MTSYRPCSTVPSLSNFELHTTRRRTTPHKQQQGKQHRHLRCCHHRAVLYCCFCCHRCSLMLLFCSCHSGVVKRARMSQSALASGTQSILSLSLFSLLDESFVPPSMHVSKIHLVIIHPPRIHLVKLFFHLISVLDQLSYVPVARLKDNSNLSLFSLLFRAM